MVKKDTPPDDEPQSKELPKREPENPAERQRSFMRQRAAILRPHDEMTAQTGTQPRAQQEDAAASQDDAQPSADERKKLLAQYRRRQRKK